MKIGAVKMLTAEESDINTLLTQVGLLHDIIFTVFLLTIRIRLKRIRIKVIVSNSKTESKW